MPYLLRNTPHFIPSLNSTSQYTLYYTEPYTVPSTVHYIFYCTVHHILHIKHHSSNIKHQSDCLIWLNPRGTRFFLSLVLFCSKLYCRLYCTIIFILHCKPYCKLCSTTLSIAVIREKADCKFFFRKYTLPASSSSFATEHFTVQYNVHYTVYYWVHYLLHCILNCTAHCNTQADIKKCFSPKKSPPT